MLDRRPNLPALPAARLLALLALLAVAAVPTLADPPPAPVVSADGAGEIRVAADGAVLRLGVQGRGGTAAAASATAAERLAALLAALKPLGDAIETPVSTGYGVSPDWQWDEQTQQQTLLGYQASSGLRVVVRDLARLGAVIDAALAGNADDVGSPEFTSSHEREARDQALELAYRQARRDAEVLARATGGALGPLVALTSNPDTFRGGMAYESIVLAAAPAGVQVENPEVTVRVNVAGRWTVEQP